jgi:nitroreductase
VEAIEALKTRRSVREFNNTPVSKDILEDIIDCGRLAATAINIQPWEFVVVTDPAMRRRIADATDHGKHIAQAAACVAVFCKDTHYYLEDGCAATQNILVAARAHGLGTCWIAGDKKDYAGRIAELLGVPQGYRLISLIAVGHPAKVPSPDKRPLKEVLHWERF